MRLRYQLAQVQAQAYAAGCALACGVGAVEGFGQMGQGGRVYTGAVVAHGDAYAAVWRALQANQHGLKLSAIDGVVVAQCACIASSGCLPRTRSSTTVLEKAF